MLLYNNKEWLYNKYVNEKLSSIQIGKIYNVSESTIRRRLRKFNIPIRSNSESHYLKNKNSCNLSQEAIEWINGELLGDGCLNSRCEYSAMFRYSSKYPEYIHYVSDKLKSFGIEQIGRMYQFKDKKYGSMTYYYCSRSYAELSTIYKQWYPEGKKIIPRNIKFTPITLRQLYIGDGSLINSKKCKSYITLATNCFKILDVEWLIKQFNKLGIKANRQKCNNVIRIPAYSTKYFLRYIGICPVKCYQYKWGH